MASTTITPYLFFGGRCEEAIEFYRTALGAEVEMIMRFTRAPIRPRPGCSRRASRRRSCTPRFGCEASRSMASDGCRHASNFDGFRLALAVPNEADARKAFDALADGGSVQMPLGKTFWSPCYGMVTDRFGLGWMVMVADPAS